MKSLIRDIWVALAGLIIGFVLVSLVYLQYRIFHDCGFMAFLRGAEWWWLFGYCK